MTMSLLGSLPIHIRNLVRKMAGSEGSNRTAAHAFCSVFLNEAPFRTICQRWDQLYDGHPYIVDAQANFSYGNDVARGYFLVREDPSSRVHDESDVGNVADEAATVSVSDDAADSDGRYLRTRL